MGWDGMGQNRINRIEWNRIEQNQTEYQADKKIRGADIKQGRAGAQFYVCYI